MRDGLYQVKYGTICAGFIVEKGRIIRCAPILKKHPKLQRFARRVGD